MSPASIADTLRRLVLTTPTPPELPDGERVYAIGDVHGRLDLLRDLLRRIRADDATRPPGNVQVILLGDLVDRGPDSAAVIEYLRAFRPEFARFRFVMGNHEEAMLDWIGGADDYRLDRGWPRFGGLETLASYGVPEALLARPGAEIAAALPRYIPRLHLAFLESFEDYVSAGDYLFVHAGVRPGVPLARQRTDDLRWIRQPFLDHSRPLGFTVVHGHTISPEPEFRANRIGIDTAAYRTGMLTALGLEGGEQWLLQTGG